MRGLDENADEEMLRYEFSKNTPIKVQILVALSIVIAFIYYNFKSCSEY